MKLPPPTNLVSHVIVVISKPQMGRVTAGRYIAGMKYPKSLGNFAYIKFIGNPVGASRQLVNVENPIPLDAQPAKPKPASIFCLANLPLEARNIFGSQDGH